jgi:hypothetical protein
MTELVSGMPANLHECEDQSWVKVQGHWAKVLVFCLIFYMEFVEDAGMKLI